MKRRLAIKFVGKRTNNASHPVGEKTHGMSKTKEYKTWAAMITRCYNAAGRDYFLYGGRGISVCRQWRDSFERFFADMGMKPVGRSIDRIDVNGNYEPKNCRWADAKTQARNRRNVTHDDLDDTGLSRQRMWQIRQNRAGLCTFCANRAADGIKNCQEHREKFREGYTKKKNVIFNKGTQ